MNKLLIFSILTCGILFLSCSEEIKKEQPIKKDDGSSKLGLIVSDLLDDETDNLGKMPTYSTMAPGTSERYDRAFENAPPMIPHSTEGLLPITKEKQMCITCHMPEIAAVVKSTPIPITHLTHYRPEVNINSDGTINPNVITEKDLEGKLDMTRYNCTQCHVPQAKIDLAIQNNFEAAFRKKEAINKSNLSENFSEGVN